MGRGNRGRAIRTSFQLQLNRCGAYLWTGPVIATRRNVGGDRKRLELHDSALAAFHPCEEVLVVNDLIDAFAREHPKEAETVKLRYFGAFTLEESAKALGISKSTAHRHWEFARAWLSREIERGGPT